MSGFRNGGTTTATAIESTFTAAGQVYNGTGAGTGTATTQPSVSSLGLNLTAAPIAGSINGATVIVFGGTGVQIQSISNGLILSGNNGVQAQNTLIPAAGVDTHNHTAFTSPGISSGVAFTPNASFDTFINVNVAAGLAGTVTVTLGPSTGAETTWCPSTNLLASMGENIPIPVPAGYKVIVTTTGGAVATVTILRY